MYYPSTPASRSWALWCTHNDDASFREYCSGYALLTGATREDWEGKSNDDILAALRENRELLLDHPRFGEVELGPSID